MTLQINLRQMVYAMADALDLVGIDNIEHSKRVAIMAIECGQALHLTATELDTLFHAALLHDCGISSSCVRRQNTSVETLEWSGAHIHCQLGYQLLHQVEPLTHLAPVILHHHTRWPQLKNTDLTEATQSITNLIFLLDRVDALSSYQIGQDILSKKNTIRQIIKEKSAILFNSDLVKIFDEVSEKEAFWLKQESRHLSRCLWQMESKNNTITINLAELKQLANVFASLVDAKSSFTLEHSRGVARLARYLAGLF
jgi:response regulator RpfG family c-di-GMP phosphodiesterase